MATDDVDVRFRALAASATGPELARSELVALRDEQRALGYIQGHLLPASLYTQVSTQLRDRVTARFITGVATPSDIVLADRSTLELEQWWLRTTGKDPNAELRVWARSVYARMAREMARPSWPLLRFRDVMTHFGPMRDKAIVDCRDRGMSWDEIGEAIGMSGSGVRRLYRRIAFEG